MLLNKTALAREALQAGSNAGLSLQERRILIMTDGKRNLNEVMALLGADILPVIDRLIRGGYIDDGRRPGLGTASSGTPAQGFGGALGGLIRAATESMQARTEQLRATASPQVARLAMPSAAPAQPAPGHAAPPPAAPGGQRRSLVAAKMYLVDMLQLQRHAEAVELKARIQFASGEPHLLQAILDGTRVLLQLTNESYGQRIVARLREVLPDDALGHFDAALAGVGPERASTPQLKVVGG